MSSVVISGDTSGAITLQAPAVSGNTTLNLPTVSGGTLVTSDSSGNVGIGTNSPTAGYRLSLTGGVGLNIQNTGASDNSVVKCSNSSKNWYFGLRGDTSNVWAVSDDSAFRMVVDTNGNLQFNSGYGSVATAYGCRAWVNFNGTGTVAIRASGNVTSITDNAVGNYTVNLTNAMPDANYSVNTVVSNNNVATYLISTIFVNNTGARVAPTTSAFNISTWNGSTLYDCVDICASVFR